MLEGLFPVRLNSREAYTTYDYFLTNTGGRDCGSANCCAAYCLVVGGRGTVCW